MSVPSPGRACRAVRVALSPSLLTRHEAAVLTLSPRRSGAATARGEMGWRRVLVLMVVAAPFTGAASAAVAAERITCLTPEERRAVIAEHRAVPLSSVLHLVRTRV